MTLELGDYVVRGEIVNTENYSTHGYLELRGCDRPLVLQLTGNCSPDLLGRHLRFRTRSTAESNGFDDGPPRADEYAWQQIGPTGEMTVAHNVPVGTSDRSGRARGEKRLILEWFGQNGRVVVELVDPILEYVDPDVDPAFEPDADSRETHRHDDAVTSIDGEPEFDTEDQHVDESDDDPYGLFPEGFENGFEEAAAEMDRRIGTSGDFGSPTHLSETELLDELIEGGDGDPIGSIFDEPFKLRRPEKLSNDEVEVELKKLLRQLALYGIAIDVCEHYTPRRVYTWLLDDILPEECAYPELRGTQWVQHFSTSDDCAECDEEFEIELEERDDRSTGTDDFDDDVPF